MIAVAAEFITLVPTVILAGLAVWWFRSSSTLWGNKDKDEAEEAEKKEMEKKDNEKKNFGGSMNAATSGANARGVKTTAATGGPADSGHRASNTASQGGQSAGGGDSRNSSEEGSRRRPKRSGHVSDDIEQGLGVGVGSSQSTQ
jgi:hypothetical protein